VVAQAGDLDRSVPDREFELIRLMLDFSDHTRVVDFPGMSALTANQKHGGMRMLRMGAGQIGVIGCQAVDQSLIEQKIQRTVNRRGSCRSAGATQLVEQLVGTDGLLCPADQLEHLLAQLGKPKVAALAQVFSLIEKHSDLLGRRQSAAGSF
jgi:hypothetical protein